MDDALTLCAGFPEAVFEAGNELIVEGTRAGRLFVLIEGAVEIRRDDVLVTTVCQPGSFLGEVAALLGTTHRSSVVAVQPTRVSVVEDAARAMAERPALLLAVARLLAVRLNAMTSYLVDIKRQYGEAAGHLGMMDEVLSGLMNLRPVDVELGSARRDVPDY